VSNWKQEFANKASKALSHELSERVIDELLLNLNADRGSLQHYGILKTADTIAQVARAQALDIDPNTLKLSPEEAHDELVRVVERFEDTGKPVLIVEGSKDE
jgi:Rad3-related DNA helicase